MCRPPGGENPLNALVLDFLGDWKTMLLTDLSAWGYVVDPATDVITVSNIYFSALRRRIAPKPRRVHESQEFQCPADRDGAYQTLKAKIEIGDDLTPHLSDRLVKVDFQDQMLNDWGIYHFHFGNGRPSRKPGFVDRTAPLLYAYVTEADLYAIDVLPHKHWSNLELLRVIHRNWPEAIAAFRVSGILNVSYNPSDQERQLRRNNGIMGLVQIAPGITYYSPGGGYTSNNMPIRAVISTDHYRRRIADMETRVKADVATLLRLIADHGRTPASPPEFKLEAHGTLFMAREVGSNVVFPLE
jgi:hypothetical protein